MSKQTWIVIALILLDCAAVSWFAWLRPHHRPAVTQPLTIIVSSVLPKQFVQSQPVPSAHIEGCAEYIQPSSGEKLEPRVLPGASIEAIRSIYGKESKREEYDYVWNTSDYSLSAYLGPGGASSNGINLNAIQGHVISTPDGIELGKDTFATLLQKMKDRGIDVSERMGDAAGIWVLTISFLSVCSQNFFQCVARITGVNINGFLMIAP